MCFLPQLVSDIQSERAEFGQKLFSEGDCILREENNLLRDTWRQNVIERLQYEKNQRKTGDIYVYIPLFCLTLKDYYGNPIPISQFLNGLETSSTPSSATD